MPAGLALRPFQATDAATVLRSAHRHHALWHEPGLGKTVTSIAIARGMGLAGPGVVVMCPAHLRLNWRREWQTWAPDTVPPLVLSWHETQHAPDAFWQAAGLVIVDEAHGLKNTDSKRSAALVPRLWRAPASLLLTGTPAPNGRPVEMYTAATVVARDRMRAAGLGGMQAWADRFIGARAWGSKDLRGTRAAGLPELRALFLGRAHPRTKAACLPELPPKQYRVLPFPASPAVAAATAQLVAILAKSLGEDPDTLGAALPDPAAILAALATTEQGLGAYAFARRVYAEAKAEVAAAHVRTCLEDGEKRLVVFGTHRALLEQVAASVRATGARADLLVGGVSQAARDDAVAAFQARAVDGVPHVLCCNFQAAGTGLTLTAACHLIMLETPWTPGEADQAEDRCHRIGQTLPLLVDLLAVEGSLDAWAAEHHAGKRGRVRQVTLPDSPLTDPEGV